MDMLQNDPDARDATLLFPAQVARQRIDATVDALLCDVPERMATHSVRPSFDQAKFRAELAAFTFDRPHELGAALHWVVEQMEHGNVQVTHPRYFGLFNPAPSFPAQCADRIAAAFNPQLASATTSPAAVAIERHVTDALARRAGLPDGAGGHFTTGGSEANFTALICALTAAHQDFASKGVRCFAGAPRIYVSRDAHLAWIKIAQMAGIGRQAVRLVATDGAGRLDAAQLDCVLRDDIAAGDVPVMIAATAGTTGAGMIDPLTACADVANATHVWFHVDAAWGGALIASCTHAKQLRGMERADSVTIDAHKWFATTMGCGVFLARRSADLVATFHVRTSFMPPGLAQDDPYATTVQWSRRFLGLRLFLSLAAAGWEGHGAQVDHAIGLAALLARDLQSLGWRVVNASPAAVLCVLPPDRAPAADIIVQRVVAAGRAWVSTTRFEGVQVVRVCISNGRTTTQDVAELVTALEAARGQKQAVLF